MVAPIGSVSGAVALTGNVEIDINLVMGAQAANRQRSLNDKLAAMNQINEGMKNFNELSSKISVLAAQIKGANPDQTLENPATHTKAINSILELCVKNGIDSKTIFGAGAPGEATLSQLTAGATAVRQKADSISSTSSTEQLMMQQAMTKLGQCTDEWSNIVSKVAQANQTIISNIGR